MLNKFLRILPILGPIAFAAVFGFISYRLGYDAGANSSPCPDEVISDEVHKLIPEQ